MIKKISIILGTIGIIALVAVLGYAVWRIMQPQSTIILPKAAGKSFEPARRAKPLPPQSSINQTSKVAGANTAKVLAATSVPADGHYISDIYLKELFVNNGGTNVVGYTSGFTYTDGSCDWTVINPNAVPITNNQFSFNYNGFIVSGTFDSSGSVTTTEQFVNYTSSDCGNGTTGSTGNTIVMSLSTCSQAGYASCGGSSCVNVAGDSQNCGSCGNVCSSGQHCSAGFCVAGTATGNGQCVAPSQTHLACGSNGTCYRKLGAGSNTDGCTTVGGTCSTSGGEANTCWGNSGMGTGAGQCYDCNGDGVINILDFSCFSLNWLKPVQ